MFLGLPVLCLMACLVTAENHMFRSSDAPVDAHHLAIHLGGDMAREYVRLINSPSIADAFQKHGTVRIDGIADSVGDGKVRIRHRAIVRVVGEPIRVLRLESMIDADLIKPAPVAAAGLMGGIAGRRVALSDTRTAELRSSVLVGDFPDGGTNY